MTQRVILVHADAGRAEGWGHLRESIEVASQLRDAGARCILVVPSEPASALTEAEKNDFEAIAIPSSDWQSGRRPDLLAALFNRFHATHLVCNLVTLSVAYQGTINEVAESWACVTELSEEELAPISFNVSRAPEFMPLGADYRHATEHVIRDTITQILVCYGGSDPQNITGRTLDWLRHSIVNGDLPHATKIVAVMGSLFDQHEEVIEAAKQLPIDVALRIAIQPSELAESARQSDIAITTSGGTMYEFSALGLPCIVVPILPKHVKNAEILASRGIVHCTRIHSDVSEDDFRSAIRWVSAPHVRAKMSAAGQHAINGTGASRIAERLIEEWQIH